MKQNSIFYASTFALCAKMKLIHSIKIDGTASTSFSYSFLITKLYKRFPSLTHTLILDVCLTMCNKACTGLNLIKLLGAYLGAQLSQVNGARRLNKRLKVL